MKCYAIGLGTVVSTFLVACSNAQSSRMTESAMSLSCTEDELELVPFEGLLRIDGSLEDLSSGNWIRVAVPSMRFNIEDSNASPRLRATIVYRGPTAKDVPLGSGELRRQFGFKFRAANTCNVVYVMWHIEPKVKLEVSVKSNPSKETHEECLDRGYMKVIPIWEHVKIPSLYVNELHVLDAQIDDALLSVSIDEKLVWRGVLPPQAFEFDGPVGVRTDNAIVDFTLSIDRTRCVTGI